MIDRLRRYLRSIRTRARLQGDPPDPEALPWGGFGLSSPLLEGPRIARLQARLALEETGRYDEATARAVDLEKTRRNLGSRGDGRATPELLEALGLDATPPV